MISFFEEYRFGKWRQVYIKHVWDVLFLPLPKHKIFIDPAQNMHPDEVGTWNKDNLTQACVVISKYSNSLYDDVVMEIHFTSIHDAVRYRLTA